MKINRRESIKGALGVAAGGLLGPAINIGSAQAQSRAETLRHVMGAVFTSLDPTLQGATRESFPLSVNIYDRLGSFARKPVPGGLSFDFDNIRGELAERIDRASDGLSFTFHIRQGATWHDGSPVTTDDIQWSLARAVTAQSLAKAQMANGSMTSTDQFKVVGERQIEVKLSRPDRLGLATFCVPFIPMFNSKLAKKHATADDPWAIAWLKENTAGGGAYTIESNRPGQQVVLKRNDNWKNSEDGKLPFFQRIIIQTIPDVSSRASLLERGDADLTLDAAASDIPGIEQRGKAKVIGLPQSNSFQCIAFNTLIEPFNNRLVRAAIAAALPYEDMFKAAMFGRGEPLFGATWETPTHSAMPQKMPLQYDLDKAKALLKEAGLANGFKTTFSFPTSASASVEPMAALIKESLAKLGIDVTVQKLPDAQLTTQVVERRLQMFFDFGTSWLPTPDYTTRVFFSGTGRWNASGWNDPEVAKLVGEARYETDKAVYDAKMLEIVKRAQRDVPVALLWHPAHDAVIAKNIEGYTYWFHRGADYRDLKRT
jgi:peptide/nickel transport system substrate-binding protein